MKLIKIVLLIFLVLLMSACAFPMKMALVNSTEKIDLKGKTLLLMSAELVNECKPEYQPSAMYLFIESADGKQLKFETDDEGTSKSASGYKYVFRVMVDKGNYIIRGIIGNGSAIHIKGITPQTGIFFMPMHSEVEVKDSSVLYLGKVNGKIRTRASDEFSAGPISFGLTGGLHQVLACFSTGTFDVSTSNNFEEDFKFMKETFPALANVQIKSQIITAFDRGKAQKEGIR
jgi:hypothetical protein